jgi:ATP-binding cassette subfamily F protein uup
VSHDRAFLDNVVTQVWAAEGDGVWREYVGGYSDWLVQRPAPAPSASPDAAAPAPRAADSRKPARTKLSFKEQRQLEGLPAEIEALEREQTELNARMAAADYHRAGPEQMKLDRQRGAQIEALLAEKFESWAALEDKRNG